MKNRKNTADFERQSPMKQYLMAAAALLCAACVQENIPEETSSPLVPMTFTAVQEGLTKTTLGSDYSIRWSTTDQISIFSASNAPGAIFSVSATADEGATASFTGLSPESASGYYYALYPASADARLTSFDGAFQASIPTTQSGVQDSFAAAANLSLALVNSKAEDDASILRFKNAGALLSFLVPGDWITRIRIESRDKTVAMTGPATILYNNGAPTVEPGTAAVPYVEVTVPEKSAGKRYYAVVYPGNYSKGFHVTFYTSSGYFNRYSSTMALQLNRNANIRLIEKNWKVTDDRYKTETGTQLIAPVIQDASRASESVISFSCGSGKRDQYYFYVREHDSMGAGSRAGKLNTVKGSNSTFSYEFKGLTVGATYDLGVSAVCVSESGYTESTVTWVEDVTITASAPDELPVPSAMSLIYGGSEDRNPFEWTQDRWQSHVSYKDNSGDEHWLFDAFLCNESALYNGNWSFVLQGLSGTYSGTKEKWSSLLDYWFDGGSFSYQSGYWNKNGWNAYNTDWSALQPITLSCGGLDNLEKAIAATASRIGEPSTKRYVVIGLPEPIYFKNFYRGVNGQDMGENFTSTTYWGSLNGTTLDFSKADDRVAAVSWYMDEIERRFDAQNYQYLELLGFYILEESLSTTTSSYRNAYKLHQTTIPKIAAHAHEMGKGLYWIPYNGAESYTKWKTLGFDMAYYQPGYYFNASQNLDAAINTLLDQGMGMELEFSHTAVAALMGADAEAYQSRVREYLSRSKSLGVYGNRPLAVFSSTNAWQQLATSKDERDKALYQELCAYLAGVGL